MTSVAPTRVSVIVPTLNRAALLREALASVRALEGPDLAVELIVADNGSSDNTPAVAAEFDARLVHAVTPGSSAACNAGLRVATGEFIAFLDDDDVYTAQHLRPQIALLRARPELAGVLGQVVLTDQSLTNTVVLPPVTMRAGGRLFRSLFECYPQIGATVVRAAVRESVGEFDEALASSQDWDWHLRLALAHRLGVVAVPSVLFRQRAPGDHEDALNARRLAYQQRVFWRNVRRAGRRAPGLPVVARIWLRHRGAFFHYFATSAALHHESQRRTRVCLALVWALRASPVHAAVRALTSARFRQSVWYALTGRAVPRRPHAVWHT